MRFGKNICCVLLDVLDILLDLFSVVEAKVVRKLNFLLTILAFLNVDGAVGFFIGAIENKSSPVRFDPNPE